MTAPTPYHGPPPGVTRRALLDALEVMSALQPLAALGETDDPLRASLKDAYEVARRLASDAARVWLDANRRDDA